MQKAWDLISTFPSTYRKKLVLLCRAQEVIIGVEGNLLAIQTSLDILPPISARTRDFQVYLQFVHDFHSWIKSPTLSSIILDMCRSTPLATSEIADQILSSWGKEVSVCEKDEDELHFDFSCWFDDRCFDRPLVEGTPANPEMATKIHLALLKWRRKCTEIILFPRMSRKLVSRDTIRKWSEVFGYNWEVDEDEGGVEMTQETLEKIYHNFGVQLGGECEIRQKWYKHGVSPRTYFAQGGDSFWKSRFVQEIAGTLTESLSVTDPISRLNPGRIRLKDRASYLRIYDLTSFTSNHQECKHFLEKIIEFCSGYEVTIVDAREGLVTIDLGILLSVYNQMNDRPGYILEQICKELADVEEYHNRAGFLGVYGNINFSTFLHGASLLMMVQSEDEVNVAGDDAHYSETPGLEYIADRIIQANGRVERTKEFRSDEIGAVCLKRGLVQVDVMCLQKLMTIFPSFANIGQLFGYCPPQFRRSNLSRHESRKLVGNELFRFFRSLSLCEVSDDLDIIHDLIRAIYESACLPKAGSLPPYGDILVPVLPDTPITLISISPLELLLHMHFTDGAVLPRIYRDETDDEFDHSLLVAGGVWNSPMSRYLKYLGVLEYVKSEEMEEVIWGIDAYNRLVDLYSGRLRRMYTFSCVVDVPVHLLF